MALWEFRKEDVEMWVFMSINQEVNIEQTLDHKQWSSSNKEFFVLLKQWKL
jgi:hypothetical protein